MKTVNAVDEDWTLLLSFFPPNWKELARVTEALKGLRQDKSEENYIRTLLLHLGCGFSLRETAVRAKQAKLAELSDVALLKRLRKSKDWLYQLCCALFEERGIQSESNLSGTLRLLDATVVKEPGKTGSLWRIHYSFQWPTLACDYFKITATGGKGTGETLRHFPFNPQDYVLVDRGYCHAGGIHYVTSKKAFVSVRLNPDSIILQTADGNKFGLLERLKSIQTAGQMGEWKVLIPYENNPPVPVRLCVIRKSQTAIALAHKKLRRCASKHGTQLQPETLVYAQYVMVLTTFPRKQFSLKQILESYRFRWQIELIFKRFKQIAQLGHLPKYDEDSAKAWLYGKLFVALLTEKLIHHARTLSPWGYKLALTANSQPLA
jgi:Transposase DDE domain